MDDEATAVEAAWHMAGKDVVGSGRRWRKWRQPKPDPTSDEGKSENQNTQQLTQAQSACSGENAG